MIVVAFVCDFVPGARRLVESSARGVPLAGFGGLTAFDPLWLSQGPPGPASGTLAGGLLPRGPARCKAFLLLCFLLALLFAPLPSLSSHGRWGKGKGPLEHSYQLCMSILGWLEAWDAQELLKLETISGQ